VKITVTYDAVLNLTIVHGVYRRAITITGPCPHKEAVELARAWVEFSEKEAR